MQLIEGWKKAYRFWSVRLGVIGTVVTSIFLASPDAAIQAWAVLPDDLKQVVHPSVIKFMGIVVLFASFGARVVRQTKLEKEVVSEQADN